MTRDPRALRAHAPPVSEEGEKYLEESLPQVDGPRPKRACRRRPRRVRRGVRDREHEAQDCNVDVCVLLPDTKSSVRWVQFDAPAFKAAFAKAGVKASINNALNDPLKQKAQAQACLAAGAKVVIETSLDNGSAASIEKLFTSKGGKAIDYDRLVLGGTASVYVSFDGTSVGRAQASGVIAAMKAKGTYKASSTIAQLWGGQTDQNAFWFKSGNDAVFNPLFKSKELKKGPAKFVPDWDANNAATIFSQMLVWTNNNIQGVLVETSIWLKIVAALFASQSGTNFAGPFFSFLLLNSGLKTASLPLLNQNAFWSVWPPQSCAMVLLAL